jgi:hypothetical protein
MALAIDSNRFWLDQPRLSLRDSKDLPAAIDAQKGSRHRQQFCLALSTGGAPETPDLPAPSTPTRRSPSTVMPASQPRRSLDTKIWPSTLKEVIRNQKRLTAHGLGIVLHKSDDDGAIAEIKEAIRLDSTESGSHESWHRAISMKDLSGAIAASGRPFA